MGEQRLLDVYEAAFLAGGPDRVVDTALVALVETGRVRVQRTGELSVVDDRSGHPIDDAVLAAIGPHGYRQVDLVRWKAGQDERFTALTERLRRDGLVSGIRAPQRLPWWPVALTTAGRRTLRELRASGADPVVPGVATGTSAAAVALHGTEQMPDRAQRNAVFHPPRPRRQRRFSPSRGSLDSAPASADGTKYWVSGGFDGFSGGGHGGGGHGGGGHGGGGHGCGGGHG